MYVLRRHTGNWFGRLMFWPYFGDYEREKYDR